jgi:tetratricopeptide (TPR) repeat protein
MVIAIIGGIIALLTLAQNLFGNGKIYWFISSKNTKGYSGPFVNHSNYGQFMNLSIGAALGLVIVKLCEGFAGKKITLPDVFEYFSSGLAKPFWLLMAVISIGTVTVFISLTRGGMISMLVAITFTTLLLASRKPLKGHGWVMVVMALLAFVCILYIGFDAVYARLATLREFDTVESGRLQILKDIAIAWTKFPITGTGLGTHSVVYPMFDRSTITALAAHADNEYAQVLEETGLVGLSSLIVFGIIVWLNYVRNIRNSSIPLCSAAYGLGFGLLAILIHSLSDFGQHLPANSFLSAIFCALLLSMAKGSRNQGQDEYGIARFWKSRWIGFVVFLGVSGIWVWAFVSADNSRVAEAWWGKALAVEKGLIDRNWRGTAGEYADLISFAGAALEREPKNIKYRYWLSVYRWRSISQQTDPNTGEPIISEGSMPVVRDIVNQLHIASAICPTYGPSYSMVGQIEEFILGDDSGAAKIRKGFLLAPCDPAACFVAGCLDVSEGKPEASIKKFERAVQLDEELFDKVVDIYINRLSRPDLAMAAAGDDIHRLRYVAAVLAEMQYNDWAEQAREKMKDLIKARCSEPDAPAWLFVSMADIYSKQQDDEAAIEYYRRALALDYSQVHWRLDLARLLAKTNRVLEAIHEAKICLRLRPQFKPAEELIGELSVRSDAFGGKGNYPDM